MKKFRLKYILNFLLPREVRLVRLGLWGLFLLLLAWLLWQAVVPSGRIVYRHDLRGASEFIGPLSPPDRVRELADGGQLVVGEPIYFSLRTPRSFDKGRLRIEYRDKFGLPLIEAGVLVDKTIWRYDLQPVANRTLDQLSLVWPVVRQDDLLLLQREPDFADVESFLANPPARSRIALYNYDAAADYLLADYESQADETVIEQPIRGAFEFYTYIKDEELDFSFRFLDLNQNRDADPLDVHLYYDGELLDAQHLDDDGVTTDSGQVSEARDLELKLAGLPEGVYKIELRANDDIVTTRLATRQQKLAFNNQLWLAADSSTPPPLFTDSRKLAVKTVDPASRQTLRAGQSELVISETYKQFETVIKGASSSDRVHEVVLEKAGVILAGNGVFSFSAEALLNPNYKKVDELLDVNRDGVDYILASYAPPEKTNGRTTATIDFDLSRAYREDHKYSFLLSLPGLKTADDQSRGLEITSISLELEGKSLWGKLFK